MSCRLFAVFQWGFFFLSVQVDSLWLLLWGIKYYCSHYGSLSHLLLTLCLRGRVRSRFHYLRFCIVSFVRMRVWLINSLILYVLRIPRWMKVTEKCCKKLIVDFRLCFFFALSNPILHYNLAFVFQGTVGRRNTKLRNESVSFVYLSFFLSLTASFVFMLNIGVFVLIH